MTNADRYEGQVVGVCGCGSPLIWNRTRDGGWRVEHADASRAEECSAMTSDRDPETVRA